ncbi:serine/threonine protein kinase [Actinoplanes sp. GCM10030250]|uniref:serine/threonine protein kinase n=1 Tax=Actinoplanes sp. GCM10030250 TaxID=3273376 RepID=UPI00360E9577
MTAGELTGPATEGPAVLPAPRPNGLFAGPPDAPDRFELVGEGLRGGEGITWRARYQGKLHTAVPLAVKALNRPDGAGADWPAPETLQRWRDRTVLLQHLHLERVVWLTEVFVGAPPHRRGEPDAGPPVPYVVMEWVEGPTLADLAGGAPATAATLAQRMRYVREVAEGLASIHTASRSAGNPSLHRDVKPTNCIVHAARGVVLIDVGGMRTLDDGFDVQGMHTPAYTAPEILRNPHRAREATGDLYALGALAVFCLLGEDPPPAGAALADLIAPKVQAVARVAGVARPDAFAAHLLTMLRSDPADRPADGPAWAERLAALATEAAATKPVEAIEPAEPASGPARRRWPLVAAGTTAALVLAGAMAYAAPWKTTGSRSATLPDVATGPAVTTATGTGSLAPGTPPGSPAAGGSLAASAGVPIAQDPAAPGPVTTSTPPAKQARPGTTVTALPTLKTANTVAPITTSSGTISSPAANSRVVNCSYFSGTARLAAGETLILAMRNLDNGDSNEYVETVFGYPEPENLGSWRGHQFFGGEPGQAYQVTLIAVDLDDVKAADSGGSDAAFNALAGAGKRLASRKVVKTSGADITCDGP